jgi:PTS system ascorbate-specific IIA component
MTLAPVAEAAIIIGAEADDWRAAVRLAGRALSDSGSTLPGYADEMVRMIEQYGPYVVIAPGLALAHARPGPDVLSDGLAVVTLATPVSFGHPHNDPVRVVLGLAIKSSDGHLESVAALANIFNGSTAIADLAAAASPAEVIEIMQAKR